ncbi:MAG: hypothetical protein FWC41_05950 [Firmicutes bacterium]|nr:hypothetical protein [Bacillota bacterium]
MKKFFVALILIDIITICILYYSGNTQYYQKVLGIIISCLIRLITDIQTLKEKDYYKLELIQKLVNLFPDIMTYLFPF